jgi:hypothetical protein
MREERMVGRIKDNLSKSVEIPYGRAGNEAVKAELRLLNHCNVIRIEENGWPCGKLSNAQKPLQTAAERHKKV